ncbi:hybrid sensor histidine kinase/response regulator transcription factor [Larkinella punicea]|uniref:histidine kinase n=1 Tax=Larkinella punicea TaxID=2315727 RepID=A0A368JDW4_9BACT|nr:response regulator [Larkinella punicea]RCR65837.1 response regulator [Larkinella punicea]
MKTKILLVDDEADLETLFRQRFRQAIQKETYEFVFARDGRQALLILEQQPDIDLILTDLNMPGMDGLTLLTRLQEINSLVPAVILTAYGDMTKIRTAMNRGAFDFLTKPIDFEDLTTTIEKSSRYIHQLHETHESKAVDAMKTRFFTNITHELRTPLSLIISPVDKLLETGDLPEHLHPPLVTVRRNARQILRLINQLMTLNQLEARQMELVEQVGDLPGFVSQLVDLFRPSADVKNLTLAYETDLPAGNYRFDAGKWETILFNLLTNAIRFTSVGGITVSLHQTSSGASLAVRDTGIGITAHKLPHVFDRYYQGDNQRIRANDTTGVSLALVRELTLRLGGTIQVESQIEGSAEPSGTVFRLELPIHRTSGDEGIPPVKAPSVAIDLPARAGESPGKNSTGIADLPPLVLVVEDNAELREFMVAELATTYRVRSAANGYEGWILAKEELPAIIITDLMMPRLDGHGLIEKLKADPATDHIAIVLLSSSADETHRLRGLTLGANDYLTKPFHLGELRLRLRNLLSHQQRLQEYYRQQLAQPDSATPLLSVGDEFLRRLYTLIEQHLDDSTLSVEWLADELAMSRKALYLKVHNLTHLSPVELIRQYRLRKAIDLLRMGHSAAETAYLVGFETPSYFTKVFREFYHQTPTSYRKG